MSSSADNALLVPDAPTHCAECNSLLCLRKQVINLAFGNTEAMYCLACLGRQNGQAPTEVLERMKGYALSRQCFAKEWKRYESVEFCPDRAGCFPDSCFS